MLPFVTQGPWWEGEINAKLFEAVLWRGQALGPARLVLAAMAALADEAGIVRGLSGVELCAAAGVDDHTYRRARKDLLKSGELILVHRACGRGNTNVWEVRPPGGIAPAAGAGRRPRRVAPPAGARPLLAAVAGSAADESDAGGGEMGGARPPIVVKGCRYGLAVVGPVGPPLIARSASILKRGYLWPGRSGAVSTRPAVADGIWAAPWKRSPIRGDHTAT